MDKPKRDPLSLLDEEFLMFSKDINLTIGFSHDGPVQDSCRYFPDGSGSFVLLEDKIPLLLKYQPYAVGMSVMDPSITKTAMRCLYISITMNCILLCLLWRM